MPATTLREQCYAYMFYGCTQLDNIKCLAYVIPNGGCTSNWLALTAKSGTFVVNSSLTIVDPNNLTTTTVKKGEAPFWGRNSDSEGLGNGIPQGWTVTTE